MAVVVDIDKHMVRNHLTLYPLLKHGNEIQQWNGIGVRHEKLDPEFLQVHQSFPAVLTEMEDEPCSVITSWQA